MNILCKLGLHKWERKYFSEPAGTYVINIHMNIPALVSDPDFKKEIKCNARRYSKEFCVRCEKPKIRAI